MKECIIGKNAIIRKNAIIKKESHRLDEVSMDDMTVFIF